MGWIVGIEPTVHNYNLLIKIGKKATGKEGTNKGQRLVYLKGRVLQLCIVLIETKTPSWIIVPGDDMGILHRSF